MENNIEIIIKSRQRDLVKDFKVRRILPSPKKRMVGPFIFVDEMGPEVLTGGKGLDVAPHPHIGLATITYLFKGEIFHRDSIGSMQSILPGEVNWMTAGSGIAHSERTPQSLRESGSEIFGIQTWVALPEKYEEVEPSFFHFGESELPIIEDKEKMVRLISGSLYGKRSPVNTFSDMFYADVLLTKNAKLEVPPEHEERAIFIVEGSVKLPVFNYPFSAGQLIVFKPGKDITLTCSSKSARLLLLGGENMGKRHIWWNFVSSRKERIDQAKEDWNKGYYPVPNETERIPLPDEPNPGVVKYP